MTSVWRIGKFLTVFELAAATPTQRNWRGILIALLVIAAVLGLIVFSIALLTPAGDDGRGRGKRPTLNDVLTDHYKPFNGTWLTESEDGVNAENSVRPHVEWQN